MNSKHSTSNGMKFGLGLALFALVSAMQFFASAQAYGQTDIISQMDQDEDGLISIREAVADPELLAAFGKIDTDGDGKLSQQELRAAQIAEKISSKTSS